MEHIKNFLEGAGKVLVLDTGSEYVLPSRNGFAKDVESLRKDSARVASSLNKETCKYVDTHSSKS
jgi:hypothetical protein